MSTLQKIIKYLAIAFAFFLIINIIGMVWFGIYGLSTILGLKEKITNKQEKVVESVQTIDFENDPTNLEKLAFLDIELEYSKLSIKIGDILKIESNSEDVTCKQDNNRIVIKEKNSNWFKKGVSSEVIVYIPSEISFETAKVETGAGEINIEKLNTKNLSFEIGAGSAKINNLVVTDSANIDGGAGKLVVSNSKINNLELDMGVGKCELSGVLTGRNNLSAGVGKLDVNLTDGIDKYSFKVSKGIGSINIDNKEMTDNMNYGEGMTLVRLDSGVGSIEVR